MAKFRTNHSRQGGKGGGMIVRVGLFAAIISALFALFNRFSGKPAEPNSGHFDGDMEHYLPSSSGEIVRHQYYTLSYVEEHEQAEWVAYVLTREELEQPWQEREDQFWPDPKIRSGSAEDSDYRGSGYDRGHLVPAADRAFSESSMKETFYFSNISPQARNFNKGIWRELEEMTRSWAKKYKKLYVVTGPILTEKGKGAIGENEVTIPAAFYKVLLDLSEPELKGIGFILPNEISYEPLFKFAVSIDEVENRTGIDFFRDLLTDELEEELESRFNIDLWEFNKEKYDLRINKWNNQ